jgi:hypothetical protein
MLNWLSRLFPVPKGASDTACSFCRKQVRPLVEGAGNDGAGVYICLKCADLAARIIRQTT